MLFHTSRSNTPLRRALRAAVASHHPAALRTLLASHGNMAFARGISGFSGRVIADALTMLADQSSARVQSHLPRAARKRLRVVDDGSEHTSNPLRIVRRASCALHRSSCRPQADVLASLDSHCDGLDFDEVLRRLVQDGPNRPTSHAATAPGLTRLANMLKTQSCTVLRRRVKFGLPDDPTRVPSRLLVRGDIVRLNAGDWVPADLRLLAQEKLVLDRAILQPWPDTCAMGDRVVAGTALAVVVATGSDTLLGILMRAPRSRGSWLDSFLTLMQRCIAKLGTASAKPSSPRSR